MASQLRRRNLPTFFDWIEDFPFGPRLGAGEHAIRVEEYQEDGTYTVKAELPGIDPERDVEISVDHGMLTLHAQRIEETKEGKRTEFLYGSFTRSIQLPEGVDEDDITAGYDSGVLTIHAPTGRVESAPRRIRVGRPPAGEGVADVPSPGPAAGMPGTPEQDRQRDVMGTGDIGDTGDSGSSGDFRDVSS